MKEAFLFFIFICYIENIISYIDNIEEDDYEIIRHDMYFAKNYFEDIRHRADNLTSFISSTINVFHFDLMMNAYRSMTELRQQYFLDQIDFEASKLTEPAKQGKDKLIVERLAFTSFQSLRYAVDNYLKILKSVQIEYKRFDVETKGYDADADNFFRKYCTTPQIFRKDNCSIALVSTVGVDAKWKYPFKTEQNNMMKAVGSFNFAHDLKFKIDILQVPFEGGKMLLTLVISRDELFYIEAQRLFQSAISGTFRVKIETVYLPKIAFSIMIKEFSIDRDQMTKPYNRYRCMTQKLVLNIQEDGISRTINNKPKENGWNETDWKYGSTYYPPKNSCVVDSPFFFTLHYIPTQEMIFLGKWRPSDGIYVENYLQASDDYF
ncbi:hypothetical protein ILUMI_11269 [Ignelater luminosus]|uniref:Uncharacterized protein n=1 Tax=Ignelater luminosus TaxID=2038154 RepID=A0A8K0CWD6_IGNLU|nr:hypothetical protein ILUMI_11269 [Ignelater luminosus]